MAETSISGVILCGGRSRRMGGIQKANLELGDRTLLQHVIDRIAPQVDPLFLSVESESAELAAYGLRQIADPIPGHAGPLTGLLSALQHAADFSEWLLLAPCDAPFLPQNLARELLIKATSSEGLACICRVGDELQPTFSLWHRDLAPSLQSAVHDQGMAGFKQFLGKHPLPVLDWRDADEDHAFMNINDLATLEQALQVLGRQVPSQPGHA